REAWDCARKRSDAVGGRAGRRIESAEPPHMRNSVPSSAVAIVSCHVEQPLHDDAWDRFLELRRRRPGGFDVIALIRPPDTAFGGAGRELGLVNCTPREGLPHAGVLPTTHSLGRLARTVWRSLPPYVHAYCHDYDLLDARRRRAFITALRVLRRRRPPGDALVLAR